MMTGMTSWMRMRGTLKREQLFLAEEVEMVEEAGERSHDSTFFRVMWKAQPRKKRAKPRRMAVSRTMSGQ